MIRSLTIRTDTLIIRHVQSTSVAQMYVYSALNVQKDLSTLHLTLTSMCVCMYYLHIQEAPFSRPGYNSWPEQNRRGYPQQLNGPQSSRDSLPHRNDQYHDQSDPAVIEETGANVCCRIFIGGLPPTVTDDILEKHFQKYEFEFSKTLSSFFVQYSGFELLFAVCEFIF